MTEESMLKDGALKGRVSGIDNFGDDEFGDDNSGGDEYRDDVSHTDGSRRFQCGNTIV